MIKSPITLILGAGASAHLQFPTGEKLHNEIVETANAIGTQELFNTGIELKEVREFGDALRRSGVLSVDAFLQTRREYLEVGKFLIARQLIKVEHEPTLHQGGSENWYFYLYNKLCGSNGCFEDLEQNQLKIVTFNYDRSLEQFLFVSLLNRFNKPINEIAQAIERLGIYHVHGKLGNLPWQGGQYTRAYNGSISPQIIAKAAEGIHLIHDEIPDLGVIQKIIAGSKEIHFLGLGYHELNMRRLGFPMKSPPSTMSGTSRGLTVHEAELIQKEYGVYLVNGRFQQRETILDLLRNHADLT